MIVTQPFNIDIMNVDKFIKNENCLPVSSHNIYKASTNTFHPDGLFSEEIFGQIGTEQRLTKFGYINLNMKIINPLIYKNLTTRFTMLYNEVILGKTYVKYDPEIKNLIAVSSNDPEGDTGYTYFLNILPKIEFLQTDSDTRKIRIDLIEKFKDRIFMDKYLVLPAGIRDIKIINNRIDKEKINSLYLSLLSLSQSIPVDMIEDPIFDGIKLNIQLKANEIYNHISGRWVEGKKGFLQDKFIARSLTLGTRNVITAADMVGGSPSDPAFLKLDETAVPLIQAIKMFQPLVYNRIKTFFMEPIFSEGHVNIPLIDPKSYNLVFKTITDAEKNNYLTSEGIDILINKFVNKNIRNLPFTIQTEDGIGYLYLVYEEEDKIFIFRNIDEFEETYSEYNKDKNLFNRSNVRPLTLIEMFYIATYDVTKNKHTITTRYPVTSVESTYPSKVKTVTTTPSKRIKAFMLINNELIEAEDYPCYPVLNKPFVDSLVLHFGKITVIGADFDMSLMKMKYQKSI